VFRCLQQGSISFGLASFIFVFVFAFAFAFVFAFAFISWLHCGFRGPHQQPRHVMDCMHVRLGVKPKGCHDAKWSTLLCTILRCCGIVRRGSRQILAKYILFSLTGPVFLRRIASTHSGVQGSDSCLVRCIMIATHARLWCSAFIITSLMGDSYRISASTLYLVCKFFLLFCLLFYLCACSRAILISNRTDIL
jgi:hypothetical protein